MKGIGRRVKGGKRGKLMVGKSGSYKGGKRDED
jgi:hypothetical protein